MKKLWIIVSILVVIGVILFLSLNDTENVGLEKGIINSNGNPNLEQQVQKSLDEPIDSGMSSIFISTNITMKDKTSPARLLIQNNANNNYAQQVRIIRNDTLEIIYASEIIDPGYKIESDYILQELEKGEYDCIAEINLLNLEDYSLVNTVNVAVTLKVKG